MKRRNEAACQEFLWLLPLDNLWLCNLQEHIEQQSILCAYFKTDMFKHESSLQKRCGATESACARHDYLIQHAV